MASFFYKAEQIVRRYNHKIVLPEGTDPRIVGAATRLKNNGVVEPIVLGNPEQVKKIADEIGADASKLCILDPSTYPEREELIKAFVERRKGKVTPEQADELLKDNNYFGTLLVYTGKADGLVSGAIHTTGDTVRPALQIIKVDKRFKKVSGSFLMIRDDEIYVFGDCAININPTSQDLAEIAMQCSETAQKYGVDPFIAMLSFSTKGSANDPLVDKVRNAVEIARNRFPELVVDGELQFDAAFVQSVAESKLKHFSLVAGNANVFVFPDLQAGNICYKLAQRFGNFEAIGPILQGLNAPVNDLSRGCNEEDVYKLCIISSMEAITHSDKKKFNPNYNQFAE